MIDRRTLLKAGGTLALGTLAAGLPARIAQAGTRSHGLSIFGELKYGPDFSHFDYVNPDAPKGGAFAFQVPNWAFNQNVHTFNTLNTFIMRGDAPPRMDSCFDTLMTGAADEPDSVYGLVAEWVEVSEDANVYRYRLRPEARFHDGSPITAQDVAFSFMLLKEQGHPALSLAIAPMVSAEADGDEEVVVTFDGEQNVQIPLTVAAGLPILSRAYYEDRDFSAATMEPPLGSGAYGVGRFEAGRFIEYDRVEDYWAADLPVNVGRNNFDRLRIDFFRERQAAFEAFKRGIIRFRQEFTARTWATEYNFPAINDGRVVRQEFDDERTPRMQGWFINLRRAKFADPRTRQALGLAFDFNWTNENLFYGLYQRTVSFFQGSDFMAEGEPEGEELALLEDFRDELPETVFGPAFMPPEADGSGRDREQMRRAVDLLREAGWRNEGGGLVNEEGQRLSVEFLINSDAFERVLSPYVRNLDAIGVRATIRHVDSAQYQDRVNRRDFDIISSAFNLAATPVDSVDQFFSSRAAQTDSSYNVAGIADPVIDALIRRAARVESRDALIPVMRAIDRVVRDRHIWIPNWNAGAHRVAFWDEFGWPDVKPDYAFPFETTWWVDPDKANSD